MKGRTSARDGPGMGGAAAGPGALSDHIAHMQTNVALCILLSSNRKLTMVVERRVRWCPTTTS